MSYATAATKLKAILDAVSSNTMGITYKYFETKPEKFPAGMLLLGANPVEEFYDTNNNLMTLSFTIRSIFADEESSGAFEKWMTFLDGLSDELRKKSNTTLDGTALMIQIVGTQQAWAADEFIQPVTFFDIQVEIKMLKSIT